MKILKKIAAFFNPAALRSYCIYAFFIMYLLGISTTFTQAKNSVSEKNFRTIASTNYEFNKAINDSIKIPEIVKPDKDGILKLNSKVGKAVGPEIKYMPEWNAFGWFTANDYVEWQVDVPENGAYDVFLEWSVSDEEAGKPFIFETKDKELKGMVGETGSWETFKTEKIGRLELSSGLQTMKFLPDSKFKEGALLDLREVRLVRVK